MKTIGIGLLFLFCTVAGLVRADRLQNRYRALCALCRDVETLLLMIRTRRIPIRQATKHLGDGPLKRLLDQGKRALLPEFSDAEKQQLIDFSDMLCIGSGEEIAAQGEALREMLQNACRAAKQDAEQAKVVRSIGVLCGAVFAVVLW